MLLGELRQATTSGLSMTEVRDLFGRHGTRGPDALRRLIDAGLAATVGLREGAAYVTVRKARGGAA